MKFIPDMNEEKTDRLEKLLLEGKSYTELARELGENRSVIINKLIMLAQEKQ